MEQLANPRRTHHPRVVVFPPLIPLTGFLLGAVAERLQPLGPWLASPMRTAVRGAGGVVLVLGAVGFAWMVLTMKRARTPIHSSSTPTTLVESGPFRFSRNPMYLFGAVAYAGLALLLVEPWSLAILPLVVAATHYGVVLREEAQLERLFGEAYRRYQERTPRWW